MLTTKKKGLSLFGVFFLAYHVQQSAHTLARNPLSALRSWKQKRVCNEENACARICTLQVQGLAHIFGVRSAGKADFFAKGLRSLGSVEDYFGRIYRMLDVFMVRPFSNFFKTWSLQGFSVSILRIRNSD